MSYISISADVDDVLEQIDDEDLVHEVQERGLKVSEDYMTKDDAKEQLEAIYHLMRLHKSREAYKLMYNYVRDVLGKAV